MRITTVTTTMEGSAEELAEYRRQAGIDNPPAATVALEQLPAASTSPKYPGGYSKPEKFVDAPMAQKVLGRRPLSDEQKLVLKTIYRAHPNMVSSATLQQVTGYSSRQMAGLMGAFGRRLTHTHGYEDGTHFFDWAWDDDGWRYGLPDSVRKAMEVENLV